MFGYYRDLTVIETEIDRNYVISKLYDKLHLCFVEMQDAEGKVPIGVAFPEYLEYSTDEEHKKDDYKFKKKKGLGRIIRLFSPDEKNLKDIRIERIYENMKEYLHITGVRNFSTCKEYVIYKRLQSEPNLERLARRKAKRADISFEEALMLLQQYKQKKIKHIPYVNMKSKSSDNYFKLFIQECIVDNFNYTGFNSYGLSNFSTIPKI